MLDFPNDLFCAVGQIVIYWSIIENKMHDCITIIYDCCGGNNLISEQNIPFSLTKMIRFWDKSFKKLEPLQPYKDDALIIIKKIKDLKADRHITTHGVFIGKRDESFHFAKLILDKTDKRLFNIFKFPISDLNEVETRMKDLATNITNFSYRLHDQFDN